jgi:hypothetical protein
MRITKEQLKQIIKEELENVLEGQSNDMEQFGLRDQGDWGAKDGPRIAPKTSPSKVETFLKKYDFLEKDVEDNGEIVIYFDDADSARIKTKDVPSEWDTDQPGAGRYVYHTGEYER